MSASKPVFLHNRWFARPARSAVAHDERHDERDQEQEKQHLRDTRGRTGEAGEAEDRREDGDDEETDRPAKHRASRQLDRSPSGAIAVPRFREAWPRSAL